MRFCRRWKVRIFANRVVNNEAQRVSYQHVPRGQTYDNFSEQAVGRDQQGIEMRDVIRSNITRMKAL